jgi:hypothetical protein
MNPHRAFLAMGVVFEGVLVLLALGIAVLADVDPFSAFHADAAAVARGLAAAAPMLGLFVLAQRFPIGGLAHIKRFLVDTLGPMLAECRWYELLLLAALAGFCEEILFRGVLQLWFTRAWGFGTALVVSNALFGLAHLITPTYAVLAGAIGVYLGWVMYAGGNANWCTPAVAHGVYDWLAFLVVVHEFRRDQMRHAELGVQNGENCAEGRQSSEC